MSPLPRLLRPRRRGRIRDLFLRLVGLTFVVAFLSLFAQIPVLMGSDGLLPASAHLEQVGERMPSALERWTKVPTVFWLDASDEALRGAALLGAACGVALLLGLAPLLALALGWALYLSLAGVARDFLYFQWDNLLLETAFFSLFIAPWGWRPKNAPAPHPLAVFLLVWLMLRLHVESAASKLLSGDPTWRDLTAMATYYETAPLPTWIGWWMHQLPLGLHKASSAFTFVAELAAPLLVFAWRPLRVVAFLVLVAMHASIVLTANYGFFNYLSAALCLFLLDDGHLRWIGARFGRRWEPSPPTRGGWWRGAFFAAAVAVLVPLSTAPFLPWFLRLPDAFPERAQALEPMAERAGELALFLGPAAEAVAPFRTFNAYHLFASMTLRRDEIVIQGSTDGVTWETYRLHHQAGDPQRPPGFVAPHQPRVDFQLWFLLLPAEERRLPADVYFRSRLGSRRATYFHELLNRLLTDPASVRPLFEHMPFGDEPPAMLRIQAWRYRFTDRSERDHSGAWWSRELRYESGPLGPR